MANEKVRPNVSGGRSAKRYAPRAVVKKSAKRARRKQDRVEVMYMTPYVFAAPRPLGPQFSTTV